jgi:hypothetical protein
LSAHNPRSPSPSSPSSAQSAERILKQSGRIGARRFLQENRIVAIRIRPHHLLCMLTFAGEGYGAEFIANFARIARLISSGEQTVEIVFAPDDICAPLLADPACHCRNATVAERDRLAAEALTDLLHQPIEQNARLQLDHPTLDRMRQAFAAGTIRQACKGCEWSPLCDKIAADAFRKTSLHYPGTCI